MDTIDFNLLATNFAQSIPAPAAAVKAPSVNQLGIFSTQSIAEEILQV